MNRIFLLILVSIFTVSTASAQTTFLKKLKKGEADCCVLRCQCSHQYLQPGLGGPASYQTRTQIPRKDNVLQLLEVGNRLFLGN